MTTGWAIEPGGTPDAVQVYLSGIDCAAADDCISVGGSYVDHVGNDAALALHWNGTSWSMMTMSAPTGAELRSISCVSTATCTAVGYDQTGPETIRPFAEKWNGAVWRTQSMPAPTGVMSAYVIGVSCRGSSMCMAVGDYTKQVGSQETQGTLAERWNGSSWSISTTATLPPKDTIDALYSVSCPSATACTAVGEDNTTIPLIERWNGNRWSIQSALPAGKVPGPPVFLGAVSCPSTDACTAVGIGNRAMPLIYSWNGTSWAIETSPAKTPAGGTVLALRDVTGAAAGAQGGR